MELIHIFALLAGIGIAAALCGLKDALLRMSIRL